MLSHDMGDSVATELVAREIEKSLPAWFSEGFKSYTFTNGSMVLELAELRIMQKLLLTPMGSFFSKLASKGLFKNQIKSAHGDGPLADVEIDRLWEMNTHNEGRAITHLTIKYLNDRKTYEAIRWLPAVGSTHIPIHLCWGTKDNVARLEMAHHLKEKVCPKAELTLMEGVGHFCQMGSPKEWLESILPYYERI